MVCKRLIRKTSHQWWSLCFCLQLTFTSSYYFQNDLCDVMRTHFSTKEHLVTIGAVKCSLATHNLQESLKSRQVVATSLLCILGVEIFVPISLYEYIISICYPLSFICKVENIAIIYKAFLPVEEHTRLLPLIRKCQCPSIRNDLSSCRPITWSAWDWVKRQPPNIVALLRDNSCLVPKIGFTIQKFFSP